MLTASLDDTLRLWDTQTGAVVAVLCGHTSSVDCMAFSPDGHQVVSGSYDNTARLWDAQSGAELATLHGHEGAVNSVAFSPDGRQVVSGSDDHTVRLWDTQNGPELAVLRGHQGQVKRVAFSTDGRRIFSIADDITVRQWNVHSMQCIQVMEGFADIAALASRSEIFPFYLLATRKAEMLLQVFASYCTPAWLPVTPSLIASHPAGRCWAYSGGFAYSHLAIFQLEGAIDLTPAPRGQGAKEAERSSPKKPWWRFW